MGIKHQDLLLALLSQTGIWNPDSTTWSLSLWRRIAKQHENVCSCDVLARVKLRQNYPCLCQHCGPAFSVMKRSESLCILCVDATTVNICYQSKHSQHSSCVIATAWDGEPTDEYFWLRSFSRLVEGKPTISFNTKDGRRLTLLTSSRAASPLCLLRQARITRAPLLAKSMAVCFPMPVLLPESEESRD